MLMRTCSVSALLAFAEDFTVLKTQARLMGQVPELARFAVSVVGNGAGPGLLVDAAARTAEESADAAARRAVEATFDEGKTVAGESAVAAGRLTGRV